MSYNIISESICGMMHREKGIGNQDAAASRHNDDIGVIVLADGAGSRKYAQQGAEIAVNTVCDYLFEHSERSFGMQDNELRSKVLSLLIDNLHEAAEKSNEKNIREFGSTLLFLVTNKKQYIAGHLGDGSILGYNDEFFTVISYPENGPDAYSTVLTTSFRAEKHLRITRGITAGTYGFILLSDGILPYLFNDGYLKKRRGYIQNTLLTASMAKHDDDASYIMIDWRA